MGGPENYNNFDTSSIITGTTDITVTIGTRTFRRRDLLLGGIALIALIAVLALAIALAVEVGRQSTGSHPRSSPIVRCDSQSCITTQCLKVGAYAKENMNETVQPCDDFYTYACGGYAAANPQTPVLVDVSPFQKVASDNTFAMISSLFHPVQRSSESSYERKLKMYFKACNNHFDKMDLKGHPFVKHIISKTPGWDLFGEFDVGGFDLQEIFNTVHVTFWTAAVFNVRVNPATNDWNQNTIYIGTETLEYSNVHMGQVYRNYIEHVASMMSYDKTQHVNPDNVKRFASDAYEVESKFLQEMLNANVYENNIESEITLERVNEDLNNTLDVVDFLKKIFSAWPNKINSQTKLQIFGESHFKKVGSFLSHFMSSEEGKRKIHNYLMWQLLHKYSHELSWNYVHVKRRLVHRKFGVKDTSDGSYNCFISMQSAMPYAISALYVKHFVHADVKKEGTRLMDSIKHQILTGIESFDWMSSDDRSTAKQKIKESLYKISYPDEMVNDDAIDTMYMSAQITDDHFSNVLNLNKIHKTQFNNYFGKFDTTRTLWRYHIYFPIVQYYNNWHEMLATAAVFQNPLFSSKGPAYYNFGGVGSLLAQHLIYAVDEHGNRVKMDKSGYGHWWANKTTVKYAQVQECAQNAQNGTDYNYLESPNGIPYQFINSGINKYYATRLMAESTGIRLSLKAYMNENGQEKLPPILAQQSASKLFFLAYAQTHCQNTYDYIKASRLRNGVNLPSRERVNSAMSQVPEFAEAFNCPASAPLANKKKCLLFP